MRSQTLKPEEALPKLYDLLVSGSVVAYRIKYVDYSVETFSSIQPQDVNRLSTAQLVVRNIVGRNPRRKKLIEILKSSYFSPALIPFESRIQVAFLSAKSDTMFEFYTCYDCKQGLFDGKAITIKGPIVTWLNNIVEYAFELEH